MFYLFLLQSILQKAQYIIGISYVDLESQSLTVKIARYLATEIELWESGIQIWIVFKQIMRRKAENCYNYIDLVIVSSFNIALKLIDDLNQ